MKINISVRIATLLLTAFALLLSGCRNYIVPEQGALSLENARISFSEVGSEEALWKGKDMDILYTILEKNGEVKISGTVIIHDSVLRSFDRVDQLMVRFNFLDDYGRVVETADITPRYVSYGSVDGPLNFITVTAAVPGTSSFAFSYFGHLFGRLDEMSEGWEIFHFPFVYDR